MTDVDPTPDHALRILIVEDNPGDVRLIREMIEGATELTERAATQRPVLSDRHPAVTTPSDPAIVHETRLADGLDRLNEELVDVVLLDLNLPDSEGLQTVEHFRDYNDAVPVVVLTGLRDREVGVEALRRGAEEYLVKDEVNPDLLVRSVYHAIERKLHERELEQYRTLVDTVDDGVYAVNDASRFVLVNDAMVSMTGYSREELLGAPSSLVIDDETVRTAEELGGSMVTGGSQATTMETELSTADGRSIPVETNFSSFPLGDGQYGRAGVVRDITERKEWERRLERQRNQLATLNSLNELVHEISHLAIESSTREEIEQSACEHLAESDSFLFAWIGEVDRAHETVVPRAESRTDGYLEEINITVDTSPEGLGPTGRAVRTGEVQVARNIPENPDYEPWRDRAEEYGFRSSAAIPIEYEDTLYGVLNVYSLRPDAFDEDERAVIGRLGGVVGHAINALERKQALMSEEVVELRFQVENALEALGIQGSTEGTITFERAIQVSDEVFLEYGTVTEEAVETLESLVEELPYYEAVNYLDESSDTRRFELRLEKPPAISAVAAHGGRMETTVFEQGDLRMVVHVPPAAEVGRVVEAVQAEYPPAEVVAQRTTTRTQRSTIAMESALLDDLTERQRAAMESAYFAGYFEWPRDSTGEDIAESLGVSPSTFHQHVRMGERKLLRALFEGEGGAAG